MRKITRGCKSTRFVGLVSVLLFISNPVLAWSAITNTDAFTDETTKEACDQDSDGNQVCFWFNEDTREDGKRIVSLWIRFALSKNSTNVLASKRWPLLRVDKNKVRDDTKLLLNLERLVGIRNYRAEAEWIAWGIQTFEIGKLPSKKGLLPQLLSGDVLKIRAFLHGGYQRDSMVSLKGLAEPLRQVSPVPLD